MPSTSEKQRRFMAMCSSPKGRRKARGKCPPLKIAEEFREADKGKHKAGHYV